MGSRKYYTEFRFLYLDNTTSDIFEGVIELSKTVDCEDGELIKEILADHYVKDNDVVVLDVDLLNFFSVH